MAGLSGTEIKAALKKGNLWNVPKICGANDGILIKPTSIKRDAAINIDDSLGNYFGLEGLPGPIKIEFDLPFDLRYDSLDSLLALYMGIAGAPVRQGATSAYAYIYKFNTNTDGLFGSFIKNMKTYIEEYPSAKVAAINIKGEAGGILQASAGIIASNKNINPTLSSPVIATITVGIGPRNVAVSAGRAYVANTGTGNVSVIDTGTNTVIATITVGTNPNAMAVSAGRAYVVNYGSNNVSVIVYQTNSTQTFENVTFFEYLNRVRFSKNVTFSNVCVEFV